MMAKKNTLGFNDWKKIELGEIVFTITPPIKLSTKDYLRKGAYPIVDQGKKTIVGYTDNHSAIFQELPAVIFGDHTKEVKFIDFPFAVGADGVKIIDSKEIEKSFLKYIIENASKKLPDLGYSRYYGELKNIIISYPNKTEQRVIAQAISTWDGAIHKIEQLIDQKEFRKKWLQQQLLAGKKRLKGFGKVNYKKIALDEILIPIRNPLIPEEKMLYQQIGIRSHGKGIFYKEMVSGKALGNKRVFWIETNCLILNIVFAWEQAVAKTTESEIGMIASHRFPMFKPVEGKLDLNYILYYFKSPRGKQLLENASPGGAGRNKTLGQAEFINQIISLPAIEEQTAIAQILQTADKEISLLKAKAEKLREQKKGLMQQLLTGRVRLKTSK